MILPVNLSCYLISVLVDTLWAILLRHTDTDESSSKSNESAASYTNLESPKQRPSENEKPGTVGLKVLNLFFDSSEFELPVRRRRVKCDAATANTWPYSARIRLKFHCVPPGNNCNDRDFVSNP